MARAKMGWKSSIVAACLICASAVILGKAGHPVAAANDTLMQADRALTAALEKGDTRAAEKFMDPDFTWIDSEGIMWAREDALRAKIKPLVGTDNDGKGLEHPYGNGKLEWLQISKGQNYSAHIWVQRGTGWRLLHMTEISVHQRDFPRARPKFDVPCINPCKELPYKPVTEGEKEALAG